MNVYANHVCDQDSIPMGDIQKKNGEEFSEFHIYFATSFVLLFVVCKVMFACMKLNNEPGSIWKTYARYYDSYR